MAQAEKLLRRKIAEANKAYRLFEPDDRLLAALSGGADSVALLLALKRFYPSLKLCACHVNHGLRGAEADRDAAFARDLCAENDIPFELCQADVAQIAKERKISTELAAREVRYAFFEQVCRKRGISLVACAHSASDNAETVLFNLTRGAALAGLSGIPPKRTLAHGIMLIRPLILAERTQIEAFLAEIGQDYVTDSTNLTDDYTRNFLRHQVLPLLKQVNPALESGLSATGDVLRDTQIFIEKTANNSLTDRVYDLAALDEPILRQCILLLYRHSGASDTPENVHITAIASLLREAARQKNRQAEICLSGGISAVISEGILSFSPTVRKTKCRPKSYKYRLSDGFFEIPDTPFAAELIDKETLLREKADVPEEYELYDSAIFDRKCNERFCVRSRVEGDTVRLGGMTRKVKELLNKKKIPTHLRSLLPFVCSEDGKSVLFIPRTALCDAHAKAVCQTNKPCRVSIYIKKGILS